MSMSNEDKITAIVYTICDFAYDGEDKKKKGYDHLIKRVSKLPPVFLSALIDNIEKIASGDLKVTFTT